MKTNRRVLYALMLAVVSGMAACDRPDGLGDLTGPSVQPQFGANSNGRSNGHSKKDVDFVRRANALTGDVTYTTSAPLGPQGGVLTFGGHKLVVPKNALKHWSHFSATLRAGDELRVDLRAWDMFGPVTTFRRQVELTLDLSDTNIQDVTGVAVYYLAPNGDIEKMPTTPNTHARSVTGFLSHFSDYIPGTLRNEPKPPVE